MQRIQKKAKAELAEARKVGLDPDRLSRLRKAVEEDTARGFYDGAVFLVARHGKVVMHEAVRHGRGVGRGLRKAKLLPEGAGGFRLAVRR